MQPGPNQGRQTNRSEISAASSQANDAKRPVTGDAAVNPPIVSRSVSAPAETSDSDTGSVASGQTAGETRSLVPAGEQRFSVPAGETRPVVPGGSEPNHNSFDPIQNVRPVERPGPSENAPISVHGETAIRGETPLNAGAGKPESTPNTTTADRVANVQRVLDAFQTAAQWNRPFRVRLHPPELGVLQIEITRVGTDISARLEVETAAAHKLMTDNLAGLKASLNRSGIAIETIEVYLIEPASAERPQDGSKSDQRQDSASQQFAQDDEREESHPESQTDDPGDDPSPETQPQASEHQPSPDEMDVQV